MEFDVAIIASKKDPAGVNIAEQLKAMQEFPATVGGSKVGLFTMEDEIIRCEEIDKKVQAAIFIFASKHVSKAGVHSLTVHSIGNWSRAEAGGKERALVPAPAALMKECLRLLEKKNREKKLDFQVMQEATHHGPYLEKPSMFIEIGSDEARWKDSEAGRIVAEAIIEAIKKHDKAKSVIGIGGTHYCANLRKVMQTDDEALAFVCPKHELQHLGADMLKQAMEKAVPAASSVAVDWKGLGQEKAGIVKMLQEIGVQFRRTSDYSGERHS